MRRLYSTLLAAFVAATFAACSGTAENKPANANASNANTAKPVAAAPTADALLAIDKQANEAWAKSDGKFFEGMLSDSFVSYDRGERMGKADIVKMIAGMKCDIKSWSLDEPQMATINADTYALTYKGTFDGSCAGPDGKSMKLPSPVRASSVYVRSGEKWLAVYHGETPIIDPKNPPPAPPKAAEKKEEPKKDAKKEESGTAPADVSTAPVKAPASPNTAALVKGHTAGWEAFKAKDAKAFDGMLTTNFAFVDPLGNYVSGKANAIKMWTETMKCEGITKVGVTDGFATSISPTVELLTSKGTADGKCDGQANGDIYQTGIYVKEGEEWKLAFMFESLGM